MPKLPEEVSSSYHGPIVRVCCFRDFDLWHKVDKSGRNKVGYLTHRNTVIYPVRYHFIESAVEKIPAWKFTVVQFACPAGAETNIEIFFTQNTLHADLMERGRVALRDQNFTFFEKPLRLPRLEPIGAEERERRWQRLLEVARRGDVLYMLDSARWISRMIARFDRGSWSHTAMYAGQGKVLEAITSGIVERSIEAYRSPVYRIGVYRVPQMTEQSADAVLAWCRRQVGKQYAWKKVTVLALKKLLHRDTGTDMSPNDYVARTDFDLIHVV